MRILLQKGKQKELIELAKMGSTWSQLGKKLGIGGAYLSSELKNERRLLDEQVYNRLSKLAEIDFNNFILLKKNDNWGRSKGGNISSGNTKKFLPPLESEELAELFGIILGDGHLEKIIKGKKIRAYSLTIAGDKINDKYYLLNYVSNLFKDLLGGPGYYSENNYNRSCYLKIHGKEIVHFFEYKGILSGNKKENNQGIPLWILQNENYLKACLRGLIDADGCIYYISKTSNQNLRISFTSVIPKLMENTRNGLIRLGFNPSKIIRQKEIYLSSKIDVSRFINKIGFSNDKHLKRLRNFKNNAPVI